tara:strand:- start:4077 stop:4565 length:489 start_codon:yes stop_codon:yes gene_type:complete
LTAIERLLFCSPWGSGVIEPLSEALAQLDPGQQRLLGPGAMEPQLQPAGERQLLLRDDQELVVWAPLLAAWRVPALLVLPDAARMGVDAALHAALLEQQGVPLLGLLQVGGDWDAPQRRADALPWLGHWDPSEPQELAAFSSLIQQRFQVLDPAQGAATLQS